MERIIQREINRFVIETFDRILRPNILEAIRQELDPTFQEGDLSSVIQSRRMGFGPPEARKQIAPGKPAPPPLDSTPAFPGQASPAPEEAPEHQELMERLIRIIMEATGFNRDEIHPRYGSPKRSIHPLQPSSHHMDAAERQFGITIELEDFIGVRTVQDIAQRISKVIARQEGVRLQPAAKAVDLDPVRDQILKSSEDEASLKRLIVTQVAVESGTSIPVALSPDE